VFSFNEILIKTDAVFPFLPLQGDGTGVVSAKKNGKIPVFSKPNFGMKPLGTELFPIAIAMPGYIKSGPSPIFS